MKLLVFLAFICGAAYTADQSIEQKLKKLQQKIIDSGNDRDLVYPEIVVKVPLGQTAYMQKLNPIYKDVINQKFEDGSTPLILATQKNNPSVVVTLINAEVHVDTIDNKNHNALWYAIENGNYEIVKMLVIYDNKPINYFLKDSYEREQLSLNYRKNKQEATTTETALIHALRKYQEPLTNKENYKKIIEHLLTHGAILPVGVILDKALRDYLSSKKIILPVLIETLYQLATSLSVLAVALEGTK